MEDFSEITLYDHKIIKKYLHPIREEISIILADQKPRTVAMIAKEMGIEHGKVFYHMKILENELGLVKVVKTKVINGIAAKYYTRRYRFIFIYADFDQTKLPQYPLLKRNAQKRMITSHFKRVVPKLENDRKAKDEDFVLMNKSLHFKEEDFPQLILELERVLYKYRTYNPDDNLYDAFISIALPVNEK